MSIKILKPGLLTTVQDKGRFGFQKYGVIVNGAMDVFALRVANLLVGNEEGAAALEVTLMGPELQFQENQLISICGACLSPMIDGQPVPEWRPVYVRKGSVLRFKGCLSGCRAYVSVAGGFDVPEVMGSRSTYVRAGFGGFAGRALQEGDELSTGAPSEWAISCLEQLAEEEQPCKAAGWGVSLDFLPAYRSDPVVRVVRGAQFEAFTEESKACLLADSFFITPQSDRMGYRLTGPKLELKEPLEVISEAVSTGTIQVPPEGNPIILLADRQTTGGYPKIAHIISVDLPVIAQAKPGERITFREVSLDEAQKIYIERERELNQLRQGLYLQQR
jgi:antagonist of KipI